MTTDFNETHKAPLSSILDSLFQPGTWVKKIIFKNLGNTTTSNLLHFMKLCPYVEKVKFDFHASEEDWARFLKVLIQSNWKLKCIPKLLKNDELGNKLCIPSISLYLVSALHFKDTIASLTITSNMLTVDSTTDIPPLKQFEKLETLHVRWHRGQYQ